MWKKLIASSISVITADLICDPTTFKENLPSYTWEEISKHKTPEKSIWLVVGQGVYDITNFIKIHPGGDKILLAAGISAEPFWNLYRIHKQEKVLQMLETMRIGNLQKGELIINQLDPYKNDPKREPVFLVHSEKPFNGEVPAERISENFITPNEEFFIRNHLPVPTIEIEKYELELVFEDNKCASFKFNNLVSMFPSIEIESSIQCAGNRRAEANQVGSTRGIEWKGGAIGNCLWKGVRLKDVISYLGEVKPEYKHVHFEAFDADPSGPFATSIPIEKAMDEDTILAYEMNGKPLPPDHGFPVRLIVPGYIGVRQVKWVKRVTLAKEECKYNWHKRDYRLFSPNDTLENVDFNKRVPVYESPVQSMIFSPFDGASFSDDSEVVFEGFAYSGGGRGITRVELTGDHGETWIEADLSKHSKPVGKEYGWTLWKAKISGEDIKDEVCVRAVDSAGNTQPERLSSVWNYRGILTNSWHCLKMNKRE